LLGFINLVVNPSEHKINHKIREKYYMDSFEKVLGTTFLGGKTGKDVFIIDNRDNGSEGSETVLGN